MLEILPIQTKEEQERLMALCSIPYDPEALAYAAYDNGVLVGGAQFRLKGRCCYVTDIRNADGVDDAEALFIMGRGLLNFVDLCGIHDAFVADPDKIDAALLARIGFFPNEAGDYTMNLRGFFDGKHH